MPWQYKKARLRPLLLARLQHLPKDRPTTSRPRTSKTTVIHFAVALGLWAGPASAQYLYSSEGFARKQCLHDTVVWLSEATHVYYFRGDTQYGMTGDSAYACEHDAENEGDVAAHPAENGR